MSPQRKFSYALILVAAALIGCSKHEKAVPSAAAAALPQAQANIQAPVAALPAQQSQTAPAATVPVPHTQQKQQGDGEQLDISTVAVSSAQLPPFPYIAWPDALSESQRWRDAQDFDRAWFIVGKGVRAVEGRVERRHFPNDDAKLSRLASERNYDLVAEGLKALGAVQVNAVGPESPEIERLNIDNLGHKLYFNPGASYKAYLIRTPEKNVWISIAVSNDHTYIMAVDEQAMKPSVRLTANTGPASARSN
jgi:hypothetical protein